MTKLAGWTQEWLQGLGQTNWREPGDWPVGVQWGGAALVFVMVLGWGWLVWLVPEQAELERSRGQSLQLKAQFSARRKDWQAGQALQSQAQVLQRQVMLLEQQLPKQVELPSLMLALERLAAEHHLQIEGLKPEADRLDHGLIEVPIQMRLTGRFVDVALFCAAVARLSRIVTLHHWTLNRSPTEQDDRLLWSVRASTYRFVGASS